MLITIIILFYLFILSVVSTQDFHFSTETKILGVTHLNDLVFHNVSKLKFDVKLVGDKMNFRRQKIIRSITHFNLINLFDAKSSCFNSPLTQHRNVFRNFNFHKLFIDEFFFLFGYLPLQRFSLRSPIPATKRKFNFGDLVLLAMIFIRL